MLVYHICFAASYAVYCFIADILGVIRKETDSLKKPEVKSLVILSFKERLHLI